MSIAELIIMGYIGGAGIGIVSLADGTTFKNLQRIKNESTQGAVAAYTFIALWPITFTIWFIKRIANFVVLLIQNIPGYFLKIYSGIKSIAS